MSLLINAIIACSIVALIFSFLKRSIVLSFPRGNKKMVEISDLIRHGAMAFLNAEYRVLVIFVAAVAILLFIPFGAASASIFLFGAVLSAIAGNIGMRTATSANSRTTQASIKSVKDGFRVAFASGSVMGFAVVGLGLLGVTLCYLLVKDPTIIYAFGFGASSIALFARVGGGIYTKAADVGADLVGKVEKGIPEDDPRNPAVIADNVGDNVGDVAGMGADLFESYVDAIIAAMVIGFTFMGTNGILIPLSLAAIGIVSSIIGSLGVRVSGENLFRALDKGILLAALAMAVISYFFLNFFLGNFGLFLSVVAGLVGAIAIGYSTEFVTTPFHKPTQKIAAAAKSGAGTNVISGISTGMLSTAVPVIAVCAVIIASFHFSGMLGVAIAAVGMLGTLGITLASDTYGSVADNAAGISEMAGLGKEVRERTELLDAVGNSTAAIGKGFAISSAALTALALFASYIVVANLDSIDVSMPRVIVGLFLGALMPFIFSSFTMSAVGKAAVSMVEEVRRQFKEIKGLMDGKAKPDYEKCISISTHAALREMVLPGLLAVLAPVAVGIALGPAALGGFLAGSIATGFLLAVFMANAGAAWDNAKKYIEQGNFGGKGSDAHKAAVVGDTVGDPFKDTAGPGLNILIKLMTIVALIVVPLLL
ncbi:MAG: sodium-translocating pyrophosphatase [Candidatus Diapherotrites archaeon]|uniref:Putative K(+)-stimulated pyrophosphate-energized sodium pump n=1 Tax=Candidatus Iainarchaeum sp. TaxID=3101447 RepID=A0A938YS35_9ARCH|nr:sodium-translocating pyrophosphatase [Candidatus Diapherotrites archaeon]